MQNTIKVAQFGLGPIGIEVIRLAATKPWARVVAGIDIDPAKVGRRLGELTGDKNLKTVPVLRSVADLPRRLKPDLVFHTAVSGLEAAMAQLVPLVSQGINVISSCEELLFPQHRAPALAARLDRLCKKNGVRVLGTGVNPGFVMDILPLFLSGVCRKIQAVDIERVVNASWRREPLQRKIGSGLAPSQFRRQLKQGKAGHAGLTDSLALLAHGLGLCVSAVKETGEPIVAERPIRTRFLEVAPGQTCGLHQRAEAICKDGVRLRLELRMYLDAPAPHDHVKIAGDPPLDFFIEGGVPGDQATVAALVNIAPILLGSPPGLRLMTELPLPRFN